MGKNIVQKLIDSHRIEGVQKSEFEDSEVLIKIDQTLTQDTTGTMTYLQFEALGIDKVRTELSVSYVDHNTLQVGFENADDHNFLQDIASRYGMVFSRLLGLAMESVTRYIWSVLEFLANRYWAQTAILPLQERLECLL